MLRCASLLCLLAGCAAPRGAAPAPALVPFAAASRFVPDGMKSFAFLQDFPLLLEVGTKPEYQVWAGRDFAAPRHVGAGASRTICIADFGTGGIDATTLAKANSAEPDGVLLGTLACWQIPGTPDDDDNSDTLWFTVHDDRFVLLATHRDDLALALEQRGDLTAVLAPFGDLSFLPADATDLIFTLPRPEELDRWGRMAPLQPMVFTISREPRRAAMFSKTPPHADFSGMMSNLWSTANPPVHQVGSWLCQTDPLRDLRPMHEQEFGPLVVMTLFGFRIFI